MVVTDEYCRDERVEEAPSIYTQDGRLLRQSVCLIPLLFATTSTAIFHVLGVNLAYIGTSMENPCFTEYYATGKTLTTKPPAPCTSPMCPRRTSRSH